MRISISYGWFMHVWISEVGRDFIWAQIVKTALHLPIYCFCHLHSHFFFFWEDLFFRGEISNAKKTLKNLSKPNLGIMNHNLDSHKMWQRACFWSPIRSSTIDFRRSNLVQARTKFNRLLAMVDDLNGNQKQAPYDVLFI